MPERGLILLAEDDEDHVLLFRHACKEAGLVNPLHVVSDGQEAIEYLEGSGAYGNHEGFPLPSLLLLDLKMPRKNGFEVLDWVRAHPTLGNLRVVVLTSSVMKEKANEAFRLGANSFLVKPSSFGEMVSLVTALNEYYIRIDRAPQIDRERP